MPKSPSMRPDRRALLAGAAIIAATAEAGSARPLEPQRTVLFTDLARTSIAPEVDEITTVGHTRPGVGAARYQTTMRTGASSFRTRSADGRWFELAEREPHLTMFGAHVDDQADDTPAWNDAIRFALDRGADLIVPPGNSRVTQLVLRIPPGKSLRILGAGKFASAIVPLRPIDGSPLVSIEAPDIDAALTIADLAIVDPSARRIGGGLRITRCARFHLRGLRIAGWAVGLELLGALIFEASDISIVDNSIGRLFSKSPATGEAPLYPNLVQFSGGDIRGNRIGTLIEHGNQIVDSRVDMEANGVAGDLGSGAVVITATMGEEIASRKLKVDGPCQYTATGCWFEQNSGQAFTARGAIAADIILDRCTFVSNEAGRDIRVEKVGGVALLDTMCVSPGSSVVLDARMERVEGGLYAGSLASTSTAASHKTRVAALDRANWATSSRLWHRDAPGNDLAWFTDKEAAAGDPKDSTAWKYGDGRVHFRHGSAGGRSSLTLAPDAVGFLGVPPVGCRRISQTLDAVNDPATRNLLRELLAALEAFGLIATQKR